MQTKEMEKLNADKLLPTIDSFAADIHISLMGEPLFQLGPLTVTNAILYGLLCSALITALMIHVARKTKITSTGGITQFIEMIVEFIIGLLKGPFGSRAAAVGYAPIFGTFFIFILISNILGILPLVGPGFHIGETPLFRPFTADLNGTIALAAIAIIFVQYLSIKKQGVKGHLKHYFTDKPWNPINFFIGIIEIFGELTRVMSLSLRLFLNVAVGEILIAAFTSLVLVGGRTPLAAMPIFVFEILVAGIQSYIFTILIATYLGIAVSHSHEHHDDNHSEEVEPEGKLVMEHSTN